MLRFGEAEAKAKALASSQDHAPTSPTTEEEQDDDAEAAARKLQQEQEEEAQKAHEQQKKQDQDGDGTVKNLPTVVRLPSASGRGWVWSSEAAQDAVAQILAWREEVLGLGGTAWPSGPGVTAGPGAPGVILSFEQQKAIHKLRIAWWKMSPRTRRRSRR